MDKTRRLYLKLKYIGKNLAPGSIGPFVDNPENPLITLDHYRSKVKDKGRLEYARIVDENGDLVRPIV